MSSCLTSFSESCKTNIRVSLRSQNVSYRHGLSSQNISYPVLCNYRKDQWFCDVLSALNRDPMTGGLTLDAFLILPIQHATRYSLLLETVLKKLDPSDERYGPAQQAHEETRAFAEAINRETDKVNSFANSKK